MIFLVSGCDSLSGIEVEAKVRNYHDLIENEGANNKEHKAE